MLFGPLASRDIASNTMKNLLLKTVCIAACLIAFTAAAVGQNSSKEPRQDDDNIIENILEGTGKATIVVVKTAGKVTWATTKFTAKHVAKPVAKTVIVKGAPAAAKFALKSSGTAAKHLLPIAAKLALL
jgi:hypothetical protein